MMLALITSEVAALSRHSMADQQLNLLRRYKLRLLRYAVGPPSSHPHPSDDQTSTSLSPLHALSRHSMADQQLNLLRRYELRLLCCVIGPPPSHPHPSDDQTSTSLSPLHSHITNLLTSIESSEYLQALSSDAAHLVFTSPDLDNVVDSVESTEIVYSKLLQGRSSGSRHVCGRRGSSLVLDLIFK